MKCKKTVVATVAATATLVGVVTNVRASVIVSSEPAGVSPTNIETQPDVGAQDIFIGTTRVINGISFATSGELTVNAEGDANSVSTDRAINIGYVEGATGVLNVIGNGAENSAMAIASNLFVGGYDNRFSQTGGTGVLNISDGGAVDIGGGQALIGFATATDTPQDGNGAANLDGIISVNGVNSTLRTGQVILGNNLVGPTGELNVTNGAQVFAQGQFESGGMTFLDGAIRVYENSTVNVDGLGSQISTHSLSLGFTGQSALTVSPDLARGLMRITNGGRVDVISDGSNGHDVQIGDGGKGSVIVSGAGSELFIDTNPNSVVRYDLKIGTISNFEDDQQTGERVYATGDGLLRIEQGGTVSVVGDISVGGQFEFASFPGFENSPNSRGVLDVRSGGEVIADNIFLFEEGRLQGDGGLVTANVIVDGGAIAPGNSPGMMTIDGDLTFATTASILEIEIGGLLDGEYDVLEVTGDLIADNGFTLELSFLDGFAPSLGDSFDFLRISGDAAFDLAMVNVITNGLLGDYGFDLNIAGGVLSFTTLRVGDPSEVPLPGAFPLMFAGLLGLGFMQKRRLRKAC